MSPSKKDEKTGSGAPAKSRTGLQERNAATKGKNSFPVVGIGASAGGLEAFGSFLKALSPKLGMAYVLVPHLDPSRESAFSPILARATKMPVLQVKDKTRLEQDHVYVIPPNCDLTIEQLELHIADRKEPRASTTIETFMRSLAADQGSNAIGIVLSGTGVDGTQGLTAIKGEGGITFAQDTETAKYDGMPASAIAAGCVDFVLPPEKIAEELGRIRQHPYVAGHQTAHVDGEYEKRDDNMTQIFRLLRRSAKVDFSEYKPPTITRRIQRRMALQKIENLSEYVKLLHRKAGEVNALYQDLLINVTNFFRNPEAFETLRQVVYPAIVKSKEQGAIRFWIPGCSTGEEVYSHTIALLEFLGDERTDIPVQIFGTDLSGSAIQVARAGIYKESIEADVSPARLRRFFHKIDGGFQISKTLRDLCIFSTQNVVSDPPFSRIDLISCRNVMIYLGQSLQKRVIPVFHYALNPGGFLMIGSTEGLLGAGSELFEMADKKQKIYRKKMVATPVTFGFALGPPDHEMTRTAAPAAPGQRAEASRAPVELQREADRLLLARYVPPAVLVNDQMEILQTRGHTGHLLELPPGKASLNLLKMARPGLVYELQNAIDEARKTGAETTRQGITVENNGKAKIGTLRVLPFKSPLQDQNSFLIVFERSLPDLETISSATTVADSEAARDETQSAQEKLIAQLRQELAATKEYLQSIIESHEATNEELQSANEEIQSGNEELQSTNEELQTSKEELESANEELHTVNEEMQHRNDLLTQLNNDLTNLFNSVNLPIVLIGADLSVRRFTTQAANVLGLTPSDVGRPIPRLRLRIDVANLEQMMLNVMQEVQAKQFELQDQEGRSCRFRINPYRTMDNRIDGVVLSVLDIDEAANRKPDGNKRSQSKNKK